MSDYVLFCLFSSQELGSVLEFADSRTVFADVHTQEAAAENKVSAQEPKLVRKNEAIAERLQEYLQRKHANSF